MSTDVISNNQRSIVSKLCMECIAVFEKLILSPTVKDWTAPRALRSLEQSRQTLSCWDNKYKVSEGGLDEAADKLWYLRRKLLQLLASIAATLSDRLIPKIRAQEFIATDQLDVCRQKALAAAQQDYRDSAAYDSVSESDGTDSDMPLSDDIDDMIKSLKTDIGLLRELAPFIERSDQCDWLNEIFSPFKKRNLAEGPQISVANNMPGAEATSPAKEA